MKTIEYLTHILDYMARNPAEIPLRPDSIAKNSGLSIDREACYLLCAKLFLDGYLDRVDDCYTINFEGCPSSEKGAYVAQAKKWDWTKIAAWIAAIAATLGAVASILQWLK